MPNENILKHLCFKYLNYELKINNTCFNIKAYRKMYDYYIILNKLIMHNQTIFETKMKLKYV